MAGLDEARALLECHGLLLLQDAALPSLATLVAGEPVRGSWWGHREASRIYDVALALEHGDVVTAKLVDGKVTFVHARLWPALVAVGSERAAWQLHDLSPGAAALLHRVDHEQEVRTAGRDAKELEARLLAASTQVHTEHGAHALELCTWQRFAATAGIGGSLPAGADARATLEASVAALPTTGKPPRLPWQRAAARPRTR
jgi:hypothetical protein